ncbi:MAG: zf-HC2 domain-containing protein [Acidobacteria bacterium]|nr:zf-HC2 domain-containing protein [Acidobacteriota bacterium]
MINEFDIELDACPSFEIAAYLDGELDGQRELSLESHFASCGICSAELNHQKHFLIQLNSRLSNESELELPKDFTRQIVANAESSVVGLRGQRERFNAVFIIAALLLFVLFALGAEAGDQFSGFAASIDQTAAVVGFLGRIVYSFFVGVVVVLRTIAAPLQIGLVGIAAGLGLFAAAAVLISKMVFRLRRI